MNVTNVKLILLREIRDQARDRRTLFMIAVLPMLLYPLLGMSFLQISQFIQEQPTRVVIVGGKCLAKLPPLVEADQFAVGLFGDDKSVALLKVEFATEGPPGTKAGSTPQDEQSRREQARRAVQAGQFDAALIFPDDFAERLALFRKAIQRQEQSPNRDRSSAGAQGRHQGKSNALTIPLQVPSPEIIYSTAFEKSLLAFGRLSDVLRRWTDDIGEANLIASGMPPDAAKPFVLETADVASESGLQGAATWAKILPMLLIVWAMTGAFYPAVDLCAGEKERGTLETLLSSPAQRSEIVLGKLLTIMLFSVITAALNLVSMGITGTAIVSHVPNLGLPPVSAMLWLALALVPVAALFSALCLALAAFARSAKEGQYYLMPLLLVTMPLVVLPMSPSVELNLGNSLIPITGLVLLLRSVLEGNSWQALQFLAPVAAVTFACCLLAIRWAVEQFNSESVLFRESERLDMVLWLRHLLRDRQPTPTVAGALFCGVLIMAVKFFLSFSLPPVEGFRAFALVTILTQLVVVLAPALLMTALFTRSASSTLLLRRPHWFAIPAAGLLAVALHPTAILLQMAVTKLYQPSEAMLKALKDWQDILLSDHDWRKVLITMFLLAVLPAICEELAFRGFILSGFRHLGHKWRAIIYSALFFGLTHGILQQSLLAVLLGTLIGYVAVQSGSILPGMVFHFVHNVLPLATVHLAAETVNRSPVLSMMMRPEGDGYAYSWPTIVVGAIAGAALLWWFARMPYQKSPEEQLQDAIAHGTTAEA